MKKASIYIIMVMLLLVAGCRKDSTIDGMLIVSESMRGDSKAMVDDLSLNWVAGESIRINGEDMNIVVNGENQAYIENVPTSNVYRALYPATLNSSASLDTDNVTVTIPDTYTYNVNNGKQVLEVPMAARSTDGSRLYFKHLTAAITVEITNYYGFAVLVDSVVVTSSDAGTEHQISGVTSINLTNDSMGIKLNSSPTVAQKKVKMLFGDGTHALKIDQGATKKVQVPVLPVGIGNKFSISVTVHKDGDAAVTKTFTKTQGTGGAMGRAKMAYAGHTVGFLFSLSSTKKAIISQGNLQYNKSTKVWSLANNQYGTTEYVGQDVGTDYAYQNIVTLFGWGTSGWNNGNEKFLPYNTTTSGSNATGNGYGPTDGASYTFDLTASYANADWGVYNNISNGGNNLWRTMTAGTSNSSCEWYYLLYIRPVYNSLMANAKYTMATIGGTYKGVIIFPDDYNHPSDTDFSGSRFNSSSNFTSNVSIAGWKKMEAAGAVFLPAAGCRAAATVSNTGTECRYWSVTMAGNDVAFATKFNKDAVSTTFASKRQHGCSVRLVMDVR